MNRTELIEKIADRMIDPWTDDPHDYEDAEPIDLEYAKTLLEDLRRDDAEMDDPDYCLPEETTPELLMEVFNCIVRKNKHELLVERLAEYITDNEMVCEYDNYYKEFSEKKLDVYPCDFIWDSFPFKPIGSMSPNNPLFLIELGQRSKDFDSSKEFAWYDRENNLLHSTDTPFADGVLDAEAFARFILSPEGEECLFYIRDNIMDDEDLANVFGKGE